MVVEDGSPKEFVDRCKRSSELRRKMWEPNFGNEDCEGRGEKRELGKARVDGRVRAEGF